jgi:uncharacterized protein DUF2752
MNRKTFWINLAALMGFCGVLMASFLLTPDPRGFGTHEQLRLPPCVFRWLTGLPCPACGLTTSFAYLAKGQFLMGAKTHPMGPPLFLLVILGAAFTLICLFQKRPFWIVLESQASFYVTVLFLAGLILNWMIQMMVDQRSLLALRSVF